ncbi:MAG: flagellar motor protein MotB [Planctomycetaceae bacterium]
MPREKKRPSSGASNAYLISFGDTMTALLAFFIVLNSLAEEQTGAKLHRGTGSFVQALNNMGMPGFFTGEVSPQSAA